MERFVMDAAFQVTYDAIRRICAWNYFFHEKMKSASRRCMHSGRFHHHLPQVASKLITSSFNLNNKDINLDVDS